MVEKIWGQIKFRPVDTALGVDSAGRRVRLLGGLATGATLRFERPF